MGLLPARAGEEARRREGERHTGMRKKWVGDVARYSHLSARVRCAIARDIFRPPTGQGRGARTAAAEDTYTSSSRESGPSVGAVSCSTSVSRQVFHGPAPRSPHRLAVRLRRSRSNTSTEFSLPGATQLSQVRSVSPSGQGVPCRFLPCTARGSSPLRAGLGVAPRVLFRPFVYLNTRDRGPAAVLVLFRLSCYTHPAVVCVM